MKNLEIDIETYSSVSLQKCGVYKYAESPDFEILLFGYSVDGSPVTTLILPAAKRFLGTFLMPLPMIQLQSGPSMHNLSASAYRGTSQIKV